MELGINFWGTIFYLIAIVFGTLLTGLSIQLAASLIPPHTAATGVMQFVAESIENAPIQEVIIITKNETCPLDYEVHVIGDWPGNRFGCFFYNGPNMIIGESCVEPNIPAKEHRAYVNWGNLGFCVRRNINFQATWNSTCIEGYTKCSEHLCVAPDEKCPIIAIRVEPEDLKDQINQPNETKIRYLNGSKSNYVVHRGGDEFEPIFRLEASVAGRPCYARGWFPEEAANYSLLQVEFGCGKYGQDGTSGILDSMDEMQLYRNNTFDDIFTDLQGYTEDIINEKVYLVARHRPKMKPKELCYDVNGVMQSKLNDLGMLASWGQYIFTLAILESLCLIPLIMFLYRDMNRRGLLRRLILANKIACMNPIYYLELFFYGIIFITLYGVQKSSKSFLVLAQVDCFTENVLRDAAFEFAELAKKNFNPSYQRVSLVLGFSVTRMVVAFMMLSYISKHEKEMRNNIEDRRNRSDTELHFLGGQRDRERERDREFEGERLHMSI